MKTELEDRAKAILTAMTNGKSAAELMHMAQAVLSLTHAMATIDGISRAR